MLKTGKFIWKERGGRGSPIVFFKQSFFSEILMLNSDKNHSEIRLEEQCLENIKLE